MKTMTKQFGKAYLDLNSKLDTLIKTLVEEASQDLGIETFGDREVEPLECRSRDGFIAASDNCGGYLYQDFTDIRMIWGSGAYPASKDARVQIDKQIEQNEKYAREEFAEEFKRLNVPEDKQNYHGLYKLGHGELAERFDSHVSDLCTEDTIMVELRVMYGGVDENGVHTAWVSAAVNWEAPYHRSHISWLPNFKCEDAKEVSVTFRNLREARSRIRKALQTVKSKIL